MLENASKPVSLDLHVRGMGPSATLAIQEKCRALRSAGRTVFNMGLGQSPFPVPVSVVESLRQAAQEKDYLPVKGLPALKEAVAEFHRRHDQIPISPEGVIIGPGSKELMFLVQLVYYGQIMVTTPCWVSYLPQAQILGRQVRLIPTTFDNRWQITAEQLLKTLESERDERRPRLLVLNYPGNPSGQTYSEAALQDLADVARQFELVILSDEIYGQLHHRGEHVSIARFYPEGTIVSSGLSKWCGAGGWRLGTFSFPPDLYWMLDALAAVASETYTSVSAPIQYAAVQAFRGGVGIERYLWHTRRILASLASECVDIFREADIRVHEPDGAFYLYLDFSKLRESLARREIRTGAGLCTAIFEEANVAMLPGCDFAQDETCLTARIALVDFDGARAIAASETIPLHEPLKRDFAQQRCGNVIGGAQRIAEWAIAQR